MKKRRVLILVVFLSILLVPMMSAVTFDMKENLTQGETLIARISGYFLEPLIPENMLLYREHSRVSMIYKVNKIGDNYYIYADFSERVPGNYSIVIQNTRHMSVTEETEEDIVQNFTITPEKASFSVNPGVVVSSNDFFIEARSFVDHEIELKTVANPEEEKEDSGFFASIFGGGAKKENATYFKLSAGQTEDLSFSKSSFNEGLNTLEISSENLTYDIPVFIEALSNEEEEGTRELKFEPSELNISLATSSTTSRVLILKNTGEERLENISISVSDSLEGYVNLSVQHISELKNGSSVSVEAFVLPSQDGKFLEGHIKAKVNEGIPIIAYSPVSLSIIPGFVPAVQPGGTPSSLKPCSDLKGKICQANLECSGSKINASDGVCCLLDCVPPKQNNTGKIIGIVLFVVIIAFVIWFYLKKYKKKARKEVNLLDIAGQGKK